MNAPDAIHLYRLLTDNGIPVWLTGGWGIDALLGEETRPHKDLDALALRADVPRLLALLASHGYQVIELWSENRWVEDDHGTRIPTAFVLRDSQGRELDIHAMDLDGEGNGIPAWAEADDFVFTPQDLSGRGTIAGVPVACLTPGSQVTCHLGYPLPEVQRQDLARLKGRFGVEIPE